MAQYHLGRERPALLHRQCMAGDHIAHIPIALAGRFWGRRWLSAMPLLSISTFYPHPHSGSEAGILSFMLVFSSPSCSGLEALAVVAISQQGSHELPITASTSPLTGCPSVSELAGLTGLEGFTEVPVKRIWGGEFIDTCELLPKAWRMEALAMRCCHVNHPRHELVTDISLWTECYTPCSQPFSSFVILIKPLYFMAYFKGQAAIMRAPPRPLMI